MAVSLGPGLDSAPCKCPSRKGSFRWGLAGAKTSSPCPRVRVPFTLLCRPHSRLCFRAVCQTAGDCRGPFSPIWVSFMSRVFVFLFGLPQLLSRVFRRTLARVFPVAFGLGGFSFFLGFRCFFSYEFGCFWGCFRNAGSSAPRSHGHSVLALDEAGDCDDYYTGASRRENLDAASLSNGPMGTFVFARRFRGNLKAARFLPSAKLRS